ncbi:glucose-6-phosphate isomerase [Roseivivax sp. CAU 1753]
MRKSIIATLVVGSAVLAGCGNMSQDQRYATGALVGGAAGLAAADASDKSGTARAVATLAGAAAGATIAANTGNAQQQPRTVSCVYPDGRPAPCPPSY